MWIFGVAIGRASAAWRPLAAGRWLEATPQPPWCRGGAGFGIAAPGLRASRAGSLHLQTWPRAFPQRTRISSRKEKKKQVAEGGNKRQSSKGRASKETKKATTDDEGRKLTRLIDRALHDISGETEVVTEPKAADCAAPRPLSLKIAKVYKPCALVVKKTELMERVADTHGIRAKRKEDIVDWLTRVLYKLRLSWSTLTMDS